MKQPITGGCACGTVRYEASAEPIVMLQCHCRDCQLATGGPCASYVVLPSDSFKITHGGPAHHLTESLAMGHQRRGFCSACGSPLTGGERAEGESPIVAVHAASLDAPESFRSQMDVWVTDALPWARMDPDLPKHDYYPPS